MRKKSLHLIPLFVLALGLSYLSGQSSTSLSPSDYGQGYSLGFSFFGEGGLGVPFRKQIGHGDQIEITTAYASITNNEEIAFGFYVGAGYNYFLGHKHKLKKRKNKMIKHYLGGKAGLYFGSGISPSAGIKWRREAFRSHQNQYSRGFELGVNYIGDGHLQEAVTLHLKFDWNWYRN